MKKSELRELSWETVNEKIGRHMFMSSVMPLIMVNREGVIVAVNRAYEEWSGFKREELLGRYMPDKIENAGTQRVAKTEVPELHKIQSVFGKTILSNRIPIYDESGELIGAWGTVEANDFEEMQELMETINYQKRKIEQYEAELRSYRVGKFAFEGILGSSKEIEKAKSNALVAAQANIDVMIRGETGVGKELFAKAIHDASARANKPLVTLNCSAISNNLVESELFGYEGGSFTGADRKGRTGKFEQANGGTLFLDEIGDMPLSTQPKLLRALEAREITRIGGQKTIPLDIQIVSATNANLEEMVERGEFRKDLYYRLTSYVVNIEPLRKRKEDIMILANYFAKELSLQNNKQIKAFSEEAKEAFTNYAWPGNVRELRNKVHNIVIRTADNAEYYIFDNSEYKSERLTEKVKEPQIDDAEDTLMGYEKRALVSALRQTGGNISKTADLLHMDRNTVYRKMKKYNLTREEFKKIRKD